MSSEMTLQKAVDLGEYDPKYLTTLSGWRDLTSHLQWQMVRQALKNRRTSLMVNWSEVANHPNFSQKPELKKIHESIEKHLKHLQQDEEKLQNFFLNK
jgi:ribulose kinase